jgi:methyl-accepting chemotaxis protein
MAEQIPVGLAEEQGGILHLLFWPVIFVSNNLRYAPKFVLLGVAFLTPLGIITYLQTKQATHDLELNQAEREGVAYATPVRVLMQAVQKNRLLHVAQLAGVGNYKQPLAAAQAELEVAVTGVDAVDARLGAALKTTDRWRRTKAALQELKATPPRDGDAADRAWSEISSSLRSLLVEDVGNNSNLVLDPDLDSYWLMTAFLQQLPAVEDALASSTTRALRSTDDPAAETERLIELAGLHGYILRTMAELSGVSLKTAYRETQNPRFGQSQTLQPSLAPAEQEATSRVSAVADTIRRSFLAPAGPSQGGDGTARAGRAGKVVAAAAEARPFYQPGRETNRALVEAATQAITATHALHEKVGPELAWLVEKRVRGFQAARASGASIAFSVSLVFMYVLTGFVLSVRWSLRSVRTAADHMIAGTTETFALESRDEVGDIAEQFNSINKALVEARALRKRVQDENEEMQANIMMLLRVVSEAADGNMTIRAKVTAGTLGAVADAFNQMMESLQNLVREIGAQLTRTQDAVARIDRSSAQMAVGASKQAEQIVEASQRVTAMSTDIQKVSENAAGAADAARRTESSAREGTTSLEDVIRGMAALRANVQAGAKKVKALGDRSMEITSIVGTIARISEQTNMLALNAAIEAARAGDHGHGFSVVADEVRKLAERTAVATQEIESLVKAIQAEANESVAAIEKQTQVVEEESQVVGNAGVTLKRIEDVSTSSAQLASDISGVARSQVAGVASVVEAMSQVSRIAKETQTEAQGTVSLTRELDQLSTQLGKTVSKFRVA